MTGVKVIATTNVAYTLKRAYNDPVEIERLDSFHNALVSYLGNRLSPAPIELSKPTAILEMGCGSGAWAIAVAERFKEATVTAIDISPFPERYIPPNLQFEQVDLTKPLPYPPASFDIIHARLVFKHLPDGPDVLTRAYNLLKPGGWLLIEEIDEFHNDNPDKPFAPVVDQAHMIWQSIAKARGATPTIGRSLEQLVSGSGLFQHVEVEKHLLQLSQQSEDPVANKLGHVWNKSLSRLALDLSETFSTQGITPDLAKAFVAELANPENKLTSDLYLLWAQKKTITTN